MFTKFHCRALLAMHRMAGGWRGGLGWSTPKSEAWVEEFNPAAKMCSKIMARSAALSIPAQVTP
jgi:hypothetical protein